MEQQPHVLENKPCFVEHKHKKQSVLEGGGGISCKNDLFPTPSNKQGFFVLFFCTKWNFVWAFIQSRILFKSTCVVKCFLFPPPINFLTIRHLLGKLVTLLGSLRLQEIFSKKRLSPIQRQQRQQQQQQQQY